MYFSCKHQLVWSQADPGNHYSCKDQKLLAWFVYFFKCQKKSVQFANTESEGWHKWPILMLKPGIRSILRDLQVQRKGCGQEEDKREEKWW